MRFYLYIAILAMLVITCRNTEDPRTSLNPVNISMPSPSELSDTIKGQLNPGENITVLINRICGDKVNSQSVASAFGSVFEPEKCKDGESLFVYINEGNIEKIIYKKKADQIFIATPEGETWFAETLLVEVIYLPVVIKGRIGETKPSLWESILSSGGNDELAGSFCNLLECQVDFTFASRDGDSFSVLYFKKFIDNEYIGRTPLLTCNYRGLKTSGNAFLFYYNNFYHFSRDGQSTLRKFLSSPVSYSRISSGFSSSRFHPILGYSRAHTGVDYAAPTGTPVSSIADGTVTYAGRLGQAGIAVKVKHRGGFESEYFHLSRIASGTRVGSRVEQGQVVGFVGSTGLSTGPHLHFGIKINGSHVNPLPVLERSSGVPLPDTEMIWFSNAIRTYSILETITNELEYIYIQKEFINLVM